MAKSSSTLARLWRATCGLATIAVFVWAAWYADSLSKAGSSGTAEPLHGAGYNCRQALAELAADYACLNSESCAMTDEERSDLRKREADVERHCN